MDAELKAKWLAALRSGDYKQGRNRLRTSRGNYCCLGVLCAIAGEKISRGDTNLWPTFAARVGILKSTENLLAGMNDGDKDRGDRKHSFAEIADFIEANL